MSIPFCRLLKDTFTLAFKYLNIFKICILKVVMSHTPLWPPHTYFPLYTHLIWIDRRVPYIIYPSATLDRVHNARLWDLSPSMQFAGEKRVLRYNCTLICVPRKKTKMKNCICIFTWATYINIHTHTYICTYIFIKTWWLVQG